MDKATKKQLALVKSMKEHQDDNVQQCRICEETKPLTSDYWHKDSYSSNGFQNACKICRSQEKVFEKDRQTKEVLKKLDKTIVDALVGSRGVKASKLPSSSDVYEQIMKAFGGPANFAQHLAATFVAAKPGSAIREKILRGIVTLSCKVTADGMADRPVDRMTDEEIRENLLKIFRNEERSEGDSGESKAG